MERNHDFQTLWPGVPNALLSADIQLQPFMQTDKSIKPSISTEQQNNSPLEIPDQSEPEVSILDLDPDIRRMAQVGANTADRHYTYEGGDVRKHEVKRDLTPFQVFMIALNGTLGVGLYWRAGQVLELGGPIAVLVSFILITLFVWAVMQCIGEMIGRWPIPGALSVFVSNFLDEELGFAVGIMYWLTYAVSFAALIAASAGELRFWIKNEVFDVAIVYIAIPLVLIFLNCLPVKYYAWIEVGSGILKTLFLFIIIIVMIFLANLPSSKDATLYNWDNTKAFDNDAFSTREPAFLTAISTAIFAFVGVEIVAALALETKPPTEEKKSSNTNVRTDNSRRSTVMSRGTRFSIIYFSLIAGAAYTLSGLLITFSVRRNACGLPRPGWLDPNDWQKSCSGSTEDIVTSSAFVLAALVNHYPQLASVFNAFLVFTAVTCAQTNLFVASRALYGLAVQLRRSDARILNYIAWFSETNHQGVPIRAVTLSALAFIWVPFLQLSDYNQGLRSDSNTDKTSTAISSFIDILSELGSVGVVIVWACECAAFLSYRHLLKKHKRYLQEIGLQYVDRRDHAMYPYRSHFQPVVGSLAFAGCIFILFVLGSASLYNGFHVEPFLSHFIAIFLFFLVWASLKIYRGRKLFTSFFDVDSSAEGFGETLLRLSELQNR